MPTSVHPPVKLWRRPSIIRALPIGHDDDVLGGPAILRSCSLNLEAELALGALSGRIFRLLYIAAYGTYKLFQFYISPKFFYQINACNPAISHNKRFSHCQFELKLLKLGGSSV